jgi:hypothetical protein
MFHTSQSEIPMTLLDVDERGDAELRPLCQFFSRQFRLEPELLDDGSEVPLESGELPLECFAS